MNEIIDRPKGRSLKPLRSLWPYGFSMTIRENDPLGGRFNPAPARPSITGSNASGGVAR